MDRPLGFNLSQPLLSWKWVDNNSVDHFCVEISSDKAFTEIVISTDEIWDTYLNQFRIDFDLNPRTRYYWRLKIQRTDSECVYTDSSWFETGMMDDAFIGEWITGKNVGNESLTFEKEFHLRDTVKSARLYACGLGLYEVYINGEKVGDEFLAPGCTNYDRWIQRQTYDITKYMVKGNNKICALAGDGWYKGRFGFEGGAENIYGDRQLFIGDLRFELNDGGMETVASDNSWKISSSTILSSSIYDGEHINELASSFSYQTITAPIDHGIIKDRESLPIKVKEKIKPKSLTQSPNGDWIIDMGQNMVGWLTFVCKEPADTEVKFFHGEVLDNGELYTDNLRLAKQEFTYIGNGSEQFVRPHFTYYGFRYVKIAGFTKAIQLGDFEGWILYSDMERTGFIETGHAKINQLIENVVWSQKGNFMDIPTDCPQRDERLGWTGDAQVFCQTAAFNMDIYPFMNKYCHDMRSEQDPQSGKIPMVVPSFHQVTDSSSAWSDAITIIPWTMYQYFGDSAILQSNYTAMKKWVAYVHGQVLEDSDGLWSSDFHYGDWLALDVDNPANPVGKTEIKFIASSYFYISAKIVEKSARILKEDVDEQYYHRIAEKIKESIQKEYFTDNGRFCLDTQTGYALALASGVVPEGKESRVAAQLNQRIKEDKGYLTTGFVGTPGLCSSLSKHGYHETACELLMNEEYPGWLYEVNLGATTIWERWNSVMPDGSMNPNGMNSLNHYAYGSIVGWMYNYLAGIQIMEDHPGFKKVKISPRPTYALRYLSAQYNSAVGNYEVYWEILSNGELIFKYKIPAGGSAIVELPDFPEGESTSLNGIEAAEFTGKDLRLSLSSGKYAFKYKPTKSYTPHFSVESPLNKLMKNQTIIELLQDAKYKESVHIDEGILSLVGHYSLMDIYRMKMPFFSPDEQSFQEIALLISKVKM